MKRNITFSADDDLLDRAREQARKENRTLNDAFRDWLKVYTGRQDRMSLDEIAGRWKHIQTGGPYSRDDLNER